MPAVRVDLNPTALNKYGIGLGEVRRVLTGTNVNRPKGQLTADDRTWEIRTNDQLHRAEEYMPLVVAYRNGRAVQLSDVATVEQSVEDLRTMGVANGTPAVLVIIYRQAGANIIETVDRLRALLPQLEASLPGTTLLFMNNDEPGVIGHIGTILGQRRINIANFALGRSETGAVAAVNVDEPADQKIGEDVMQAIRALPAVKNAWLVRV